MNEIMIAAVIPSYKVTAHILDVISAIGSECNAIYVVDDKCPDESGKYVLENCKDPRVKVVFHEVNQGVGGAVISGYRAAMADNAEVIVKIDGDGQMDPALLLDFVAPILSGEADYTKGNRFYDLEEIGAMPKIRIFGNAVLSLMSKFSTGYWSLFDPTNGYTAIHSDVLKLLPLDKLSKRYFFETDILFRLNTFRAVVMDVPMSAKYGDEVSGLKISNIVGEFLFKHIRNFFKRIFYNYYLRDLTVASLELPLGVLMLLFGSLFGAYQWTLSAIRGVDTPLGTIMVATLPILVGIQLCLAFLSYDVTNVPNRPIQLKNKLRSKFNYLLGNK